MRQAFPVFLLLLSFLAAPAASAAPASFDDARPSAQQAGDPLSIALAHIESRAASLGLTARDVAGLIVTDQYASEHTGVTHIYLRQQHEGIEVVGANVNINIMPDGSVLSMNQSLVPNLAGAIDRKHPDITAVEATESAADDKGLEAPEDLEVVEEVGGEAQEVVLSEGGISQEPIPAKLVYAIVGPGDVRLAWQVEVYENSGEHWWNLRIDAATGEVLGEDDYVSHAQPEYEVYAQPKESPTDGPRTVEIDPAAAALNASPFGWHDTDGAAGPEFTTTQGNNVHAYTDTDANNVPDADSSPDGGADLHFSFPLDLAQQPSTYRDAAVTNLFYWNNIIHDVFYQYGFDEASGNFQVNNHGKGGLGNDDVRAEAQDGSGTNNANFATPPDGQRPRMQMYIWESDRTLDFMVNSPAAIAGAYPAAGAAFGPGSFALTANVVAAEDSTDPPGPSTTDGCTPLTNAGAVAGNIALIDRGSCNFTVKVKNAQDAGAVGVIIANNVPATPGAMTGVDPTITIPSIMVSQAAGVLIRGELPGVNVTMEGTDGGPHRDSSLDSGLIIHEYGHGISNRLTGGPSISGCLSNAEQMGEGWSDWLALVLTTDPTDKAGTPRGIFTYARFEPATGVGSRPAQYTTDMSVNPFTYGDLTGLVAPHGVGFAWATMLWDMYWELVDDHGYNADLYAADMTAGNQLAIQLVMDGMKLQPCSPGFVDGRNAILQADVALTGGANQCAIWTAFANRGLGANASQGSSFNKNDGVENFDLPEACGGPPDTIPPGVSILINGGGGFTGSPNVSLALSAGDSSGVATYRLAETLVGLDLAAEVAIVPPAIIFKATVPFTLTGGEGLKEVWLRVCDAQDNCADASDTIVLDPSTHVNPAPLAYASGSASLYPSTIAVSGVFGEIVSVTVSLWNVSHTWPEDLNVLLVGPTGQTLLLLSDVAGDINTSPGWSGIDLTFDDTGAGLPCVPVAVSSGTYQPTDCPDAWGDDDFPGPAPQPAYGTAFAPYLALNPNGLWSLYVYDDVSGDGGQIAGGWSITIETVLTEDSFQGCLYAGSLSQMTRLPNGQSPTVTCVRGIAISLYEGTDYWACLYAGALTQVSTTMAANCGRGTRIGFAAGIDIWACLYAGALSQVGTTQPVCARGAAVGFARVH